MIKINLFQGGRLGTYPTNKKKGGKYLLTIFFIKNNNRQIFIRNPDLIFFLLLSFLMFHRK